MHVLFFDQKYFEFLPFVCYQQKIVVLKKYSKKYKIEIL